MSTTQNPHASLGKRGNPTNSNPIDLKPSASKKRDSKSNRDTQASDSGAGPGDFSNFPDIDPKTVTTLKSRGIVSLFPIQQECFKPIYGRQDVIGRDLTGSGKTFAFALPIVEYLRANDLFGTGKTQAIFLAPTRELAIQITDECNKLKHDPGEFSVVTVYGGVSVQNQARQLKSGVDLFVGTTGRVLDHIERENIDFSELKTLVLDEADVMLNMGFKEDIEKVLEKAGEVIDKKFLQVCLFSATLPDWIDEVARTYMKDDLKLIDLAQDLSNKTSKKVSHLALECSWHQRFEAVNKVLQVHSGDGKVIVFTATKRDADELGQGNNLEVDCEVMHGGISQNQRQATIKRYKEGKFKVLVATDVASRGLDVKGVTLVVQLEPPKDTESYIHRSGRTARAGQSGTCVTLFNGKNVEFLERVEEHAGITMDRIEIPSDEDVEKAKAEQEEREKLNPKVIVKSLLSGDEHLQTIKMTKSDTDKIENLDKKTGHDLLKKYWAPKIFESMKNMRSMTEGEGVVFDLGVYMADSFVESYHQLKQNFSRVEFEVELCTELPELKDPSDDPDPEPEESYEDVCDDN